MPDPEFPIHDLFAKPLVERASPSDTRLPLLTYRDHLLRRFGLAELVRLEPEAQTETRSRQVADEVWALADGQVEFSWHDLREGSPTQGAQFVLRCDRPTLVLVPFGVAFSVRALKHPAELIRLATHEDPVDEVIDVE